MDSIPFKRTKPTITTVLKCKCIIILPTYVRIVKRPTWEIDLLGNTASLMEPVCALSGFSARHVCGYIKPGPRFASTFVVVFFVMFTDFN
jgi:hypothetical protein